MMKSSQANQFMNRTLLLFVTLSLVVLATACNFDLVPADKTLENISLADAQNLVPFTICTPEFLPDGIALVPRASYHADMGDPQDADVRLLYFGLNEKAPDVEVFQKIDPINLDRYYRDADGREVAIEKLLSWLVGDYKSVQAIRPQATISVTQYTDAFARWAFQIAEPASILGNLVEWVDGSKHYQLYTRLTLEEAKRIAQSMKDCAVLSTSTPASR